jgi:hypothetical protein
LLQRITEEGQRLGAISDMNISDMSANAPVGTTLALLERTLKPMAAVQARVHYAMKQEFKLLKELIRDYTSETYSYDPQDTNNRQIKQSDYDMVEVIPVSDPNSSTMAQRVVQYQAVLQMAQQAPQIYNLPQLHRQMIEVLGVKNADKLVPIEDDATPKDPVQENQDIINMKPVKAFMEQNHEAHIATHMAAMQNPKIQQLMQMNPQAQAIMAAGMAHINEHMAFEYRKQIEMAIGGTLPHYEDGEQHKKIDPEMADKIAVAVAQASQQINQRDQQQAAQQQAQQQMQDPIVQMQQQELQIKMQELQLKQQKQQIDAAAKADQLRIEQSRIDSQKEIAAMQVAATAAATRDKLQRQQETEGARLGIDIAKNKMQQRQFKQPVSGKSE